MDNIAHVDRLREQYDILAGLLSDMPAQLDERTDDFFIGERDNTIKHILCEIRCILKDVLEDNDIKNRALRAEVQRFLRLIDRLIRVLRNIDFDDFNINSERLIGRFLCLLIRLFLILLTLIAKLIILLSVCRDFERRFNNVRFGFCRCLIDEFARELDDLARVLNEFERLAMEFRRFRPRDCNRPCKCRPCQCKPCDCNRPCKCRPCQCRSCDFDRVW